MYIYIYYAGIVIYIKLYMCMYIHKYYITIVFFLPKKRDQFALIYLDNSF